MNKNLQYDVTIVGACPAGSMLAYKLTKRGVKVLLLEKYKLPHCKICAGGITVRAASLLPLDITSVAEEVVYGARLSYNKVPKRVRTYDKPLIYMVMRDKFDYLLASKAGEAGAVLEDNTEVKNIEVGEYCVLVKTKSETISTPILVGADGANSVVVRSLGLEKGYEYGLGVNSNIEVKGDKLSEWEGLLGLDYGIVGGYSWVFPKSTCLSVGSGGSFRVARKLKSYTLDLIKAYNLGKTDDCDIRGHLMPVRKATAPLSRHRVLLVGDAAGLIDPLMGEGIYYALRSVDLAVPAIMGLLEGRTGDLLEYDEALNSEFASEFKIARNLRKMNSAVPHLFFQLLKDNDRFWRAFCRLLRGEKNYVSLKSSLSPPLQLLFRYF